MTDEKRAAKKAYMAEWAKKNADRLKAKRQTPEELERQRKATTEYRERHPERVVESNLRQYTKFAAQVRVASLARYYADWERRNKYRADYYLKNSVSLRQAAKTYKDAHPGAYRSYGAARRSRLKQGDGLSKGVVAFLMATQKGKCVNCRNELKISGYHVDHIHPLSKGGHNSDGNVQLLCPPCNLSKHDKDPIDWAQQQGRLL